MNNSTDELAMFADLRPEDGLSASDLDSIRAELFPLATQPTTHGERVDGIAPVHEFSAWPPRRRKVTLAAAAITVLGLGGLWAATTRDRQPATATPPTPASTTPSPVTTPSSTTSEYEIPLVGFAESGWTLTDAFDGRLETQRTVVFLSDSGFDGPWVDATLQGTGGVVTESVPPGASSDEVNGATANVTELDDGVIVRWEDDAGNSFEMFGWQTSLEQVIALAETTTLTDRGIAVGELPGGATLAADSQVAALDHAVSYRFTHDDGREVEITFTGGGERGLYLRVGPRSTWSQEGVDGWREITVGDEPAMIVTFAANPTSISGTTQADPITIIATDRAASPPTSADTVPPTTSSSMTQEPLSGGRYRIDILRGFWTWEITTEGFASEQQVIDLVNGATEVNETMWTAQLGDAIVNPGERVTTAQELVVNVPLPPGFDTATFDEEVTDSRTQFIGEVSGVVACGWFNELFEARQAGDIPRQNAAQAALATTVDWAMLDEIDDVSDWPSVLRGVTASIDEQSISEAEDPLGCREQY